MAAKWLLGLTNDFDWGLKVWDDLEEKNVPKHRNFKETLFNFLSGCRFVYPKRLTQKALIRHFLGDETVYFTGSRGERTLLMLDIDCHKSGSLEGARQFAQYLKEHFFPNLYYETSTNGNGIHGYIVVDIWNWAAADYNNVLKEAEKWLKKVLASTDFDVETVELKGRCPSVIWGEDYDRQVKHFTMGGLAKMPRDWTRFAEWKATTKMSAHDLRKLPERYPVQSTPEVEVHVEKQEKAGSVRGKLIDIERVQKYLPLAQRFVPEPQQLVSEKSQVFVNADDVAVFLVLLEFFTEHPNPDGSMPYKRFAGLWQKLYDDGEVKRQFDNKRFAWIRNRVSSLGGIEWEDVTYSVGFGDVKGKAAKWQASEELRALMREYAVAGSDVDAGDECDTSGGEVRLLIYHNHNARVSESGISTIDSLWKKMPISNLCHVGLRPVLVFAKHDHVYLEDYLDELKAAGLEWMAA